MVTKELKLLCDECRSNSCIEHATGIMEVLKAPENLSKQISNVHISGVDTKVQIMLFLLSGREQMLS